ncbi:MAG: DEAD/DEAH box helicase, partial [Anaerolineae bacterium]
MSEIDSPATDGVENTLADVSLDQLSEPLRAAAARAGWNELMPVQARAIPYLLAGRGMMIQARTGSGKTGAY